MSDTTPKTDSRLPFNHWGPLGCLVIAYAWLGAYLYDKPANGGIREFMMQGFLFSQPILLAFWAGFAPQPFRQRFLWAFLLCILVAFAEELGPLLTAHYTDVHHTDSGFLMILFFGLFSVATVLFLIIRRLSRWRIKHSVIEDACSDYEPTQFGIKHLIILISITALACGLARSLVLLGSGSPLGLSGLRFVVGLVGIVCFLFPVLAIPWCVMTCRPRMMLLIITMAIIWVACSLAGYMIVVTAQEPRGDMEFTKPMLFMQLGAGLSVLLSTLVMRFCGFRMIRMPKASPR